MMDEEDFQAIRLPWAFVAIIVLGTKIKPLISSSALNSQTH